MTPEENPTVLSVSDAAQRYFRHLLKQQDAEDLAIVIAASRPGTPGADCELAFCDPSDKGADHPVMKLDGFELYIDAQSVEFLQDAVVDYDEDTTGGKLTIRAPNLRGQAPSDDASLHDRVQWLIQAEINPALANHGGFVGLVEVTEDGFAVLQFGGGCHGCGMVDVTLKDGIEKTLVERVPEINGVRDVTEHEKGENPYYS